MVFLHFSLVHKRDLSCHNRHRLEFFLLVDDFIIAIKFFYPFNNFILLIIVRETFDKVLQKIPKSTRV